MTLVICIHYGIVQYFGLYARGSHYIMMNLLETLKQTSHDPDMKYVFLIHRRDLHWIPRQFRQTVTQAGSSSYESMFFRNDHLTGQ